MKQQVEKLKTDYDQLRTQSQTTQDAKDKEVKQLQQDKENLERSLKDTKADMKKQVKKLKTDYDQLNT